MPRFVILHHQLAGGEHWDLMLEHGGMLLTWQLASPPEGVESLPIPARHIGDHRLAYLDYEGPVSGDRGHVRRVDTGPIRSIRIAPGRIEVDLAGRCLRGRFALERLEGEAWRLVQP